ncbi:MAG: hypothetical protein ACOCSK_01395 [Rhodothermales bacterium]
MRWLIDLLRRLFLLVRRTRSKRIAREAASGPGADTFAGSDEVAPREYEEEACQTQLDEAPQNEGERPAQRLPVDEHPPTENEESPPPPALRRRPGTETRRRGGYRQRVASPQVQLDPMSGRFRLVIPPQRIPADVYGSATEHIVAVTVGFFEDARTAQNEDAFCDRSVALEIAEDSVHRVRTRELTVELEKSFFWLHVKYPSVLKEKEFFFPQPTPEIYVFEEKSDGRITMFNRYEKPEYPHPLPRGFLWLVHTDDIEVPESLIVESDTRRFWDQYHATLVDTRESEQLQLYNAEEGKPVPLPTRLQPELRGVRIRDAEPAHMPAFTSELKVHVPESVQETVQLFVRSENARTREEHEIRPDPAEPFDLGRVVGTRPGVYRLDVGTSSKQDDWESIWFRWLPHIAALDYPQGLIMPGPNGHEEIVARLQFSGRSIPVFDDAGVKIGPPREGVLSVRMGPGEDEKELFLGAPRRPRGVPLVVRLLRLRWRLVKADEESNWADVPIAVGRDKVSVGSTAMIRTNIGPRAASGVRFELRSRSETVQVAKADVVGGEFQVPLSQFDATAREHREALFLVVALDGTVKTTATAVAEVEPIGYRCRWCEHVAATREELVEHVSQTHVRDIFGALTYDEIRRRHVPELPAKIYQCSHCRAYVKAADTGGRNPTTSIYHHIDEFHPEQPHAFRIVDDTAEIRRAVDINLPHIYQCSLCGDDIRIGEEDSEEPLVEHLLKVHSDELWE